MTLADQVAPDTPSARSEQARQRARARRRRQREQEQCLDCTESVFPGRVRCLDCLERVNAREAQLRDEARAAGLCWKCRRRSPVRPGEQCEHCGGRATRRARERYRALIAAGTCTDCGRQPAEGANRCSRCLAARRASNDQTRRQRRKERRCQQCGSKPLPGLMRCRVCHQAALTRSRVGRTIRLGQGLCLRCDKQRGKDGTRLHCRPCADLHSATLRATRARLKRQHRCTVCCGPMDRDGAYCVKCTDVARARYYRLHHKQPHCSRCDCSGHTNRMCPLREETDGRARHRTRARAPVRSVRERSVTHTDPPHAHQGGSDEA